MGKYNDMRMGGKFELRVVDIDEKAERDVGSMEEWASACGVQRSEGLQLTVSDSNGGEEGWNNVEVMSVSDMAEGSPVLYVPGDMVLSSRKAQEEFGVLEEAEELLRKLDHDEDIALFYLFLKILMEYEQGEQSSWYSWLNSLPRLYTNGASMTPFCYDCLPPLAAKMAMDGKFKVINFSAALQKVPFLAPDSDIRTNRDLAKWAFQVASTRGIPFFDPSSGQVDDVRLPPMVDMLNHGGIYANVQVSYDDSSAANDCYVYTTSDVPAGSPLRMCYGEPTNPSKLFATYGFIDDTAPASFCKIMIDKPSTQLKEMGYDFSTMLFYKDTGQVSEQVWDILLYQHLHQNDLNQHKQQLYQAHIHSDYETKQVLHTQYYPQTLQALQHHVTDFLTQLDDLSVKASNMDITTHPRLPLIQKHNDFVKQTFLAVQSQLPIN